ncbi:MAG: hypothetical protein JXJ04_11435, partial [Spirochaetales bacterium]|nr:hypothetical protein [Spirochaetales bacterium]
MPGKETIFDKLNRDEIFDLLLKKKGLLKTNVEETIQPVSRDGDLPLSFSQKRLWFLDCYDSGSPYYNMPFAVKIKGTLQIDVLEKSIQEIIRQNEILRTQFYSDGERLLQNIITDFKFQLKKMDISRFSSEEKEKKLKEIIHNEVNYIFNLQKELLIRIRLVQTGKEEYVLIQNIHHIVFDGWSIGIFVKELMEYYKAFASKKDI